MTKIEEEKMGIDSMGLDPKITDADKFEAPKHDGDKSPEKRNEKEINPETITRNQLKAELGDDLEEIFKSQGYVATETGYENKYKKGDKKVDVFKNPDCIYNMKMMALADSELNFTIDLEKDERYQGEMSHAMIDADNMGLINIIVKVPKYQEKVDENNPEFDYYNIHAEMISKTFDDPRTLRELAEEYRKIIQKEILEKYLTRYKDKNEYRIFQENLHDSIKELQ